MTSRDFASELVIKREEEKREQNKARAKALQNNMKKTLKALIQREEVRKAIGQDVIEAGNDPSRLNEMLKNAANGIFKSNDFEIVTGFEPRPWEED